MSTLAVGILAGSMCLPATTSMPSYLSTTAYAGMTYVGATIITNAASCVLSKSTLFTSASSKNVEAPQPPPQRQNMQVKELREKMEQKPNPSPNSLKKPILKVIPMNGEFNKTIKEWIAEAKSKVTNPETYTQTFRNCLFACEMILDTIRKQKKSPNVRHEFYACVDENDNPEGAMTIVNNRKELYIADLTTNPKNLWDSGRKISGVGRMLVQFTEERAIQLKKEKVTLIPLEGVRSFYEHLGFAQEKGRPNCPSCMSKWVLQKVQDSAA